MIGRREVLKGIGLLTLMRSTDPWIATVSASIVATVIVECQFNGKQFVVFDDQPQIIFAFEGEYEFRLGERVSFLA